MRRTWEEEEEEDSIAIMWFDPAVGENNIISGYSSWRWKLLQHWRSFLVQQKVFPFKQLPCRLPSLVTLMTKPPMIVWLNLVNFQIDIIDVQTMLTSDVEQMMMFNFALDWSPNKILYIIRKRWHRQLTLWHNMSSVGTSAADSAHSNSVEECCPLYVILWNAWRNSTILACK